MLGNSRHHNRDEEKILQIGQIITYLKTKNDELQVWAEPSTPLEQVTECKGKIEDAATQIEDYEKMAKRMVE